MVQGTFKSAKANDIICNQIWSSVLTKTAVSVQTPEEEQIDEDVDDPSDIDEDQEDAEALAGELEDRSASSRRDGSVRLPASETVAPPKSHTVKAKKSSSVQPKPPTKVSGAGIIADTDSDSAPEAEPVRPSARAAAPDMPKISRPRTWTKLWGDVDADLLQRCFGDYILERRANRALKVTVTDIKSKLKSETAPFSSLLDNYGPIKIAERIRYLVRKP